jgi:hypothetical protein
MADQIIIIMEEAEPSRKILAVLALRLSMTGAVSTVVARINLKSIILNKSANLIG